MQADVNTILAAANAVAGIEKATARAFRESDTYPLFYCGQRRLPEGSNTPKNTANTTYDQQWQFINHLYVQANTGEGRDGDYSDYELAEQLTDQFLDGLLVDGNAEFVLVSADIYPAMLGGDELILSEIILEKFQTKRYGQA